MTHDSGFAPNPFFGYLTLATFMTGIRRTKVVGDWVAGFASKTFVKKCHALGFEIPHQGLIYLMGIGEILRSLTDRFESKAAPDSPRPVPIEAAGVQQAN
jgi:hypothetical protein